MSTPTATTPTSAMPDERRAWQILIVLCLAVFMLLLDTTVVNVAQVKIKDSLGASLTQIQWILDSYILAYAVLLLSFGRLGDIYGRKRFFMIGMAIFTTASVLCGASEWIGNQTGLSGVNLLIFFRVLQGIGGAFMMPQSLSLLTVNFPAERRGAALGIWGSVVALGAIIGPVIGGLIVTDYSWPWIFLINLPVGVVSLFLVHRIVPESTDPLASRKIDWAGVLLSGIGIFCLVFACIEGTRLGWTSVEIVGLFVASAVLMGMFIWWERRVADPIVKIELFSDRNFTVANIIAMVISFGMLGIFFPITLFLQEVLGFSPVKAGLAMMPMSLMILVGAPIAGRLSDRIGARWLLFAGTAIMSLGILFITSRVSTDTTIASLAPALIVTGIGMGMTFSPMTAAAMRDVPPRVAGSASGVLNTTRNIGQVLGIAILGSVLQARMATHTADGLVPLGLDSATADKVVDLAKQNQFPQIVSLIPADQLGPLMDVIKEAFVQSTRNTFVVGAIACGIASLLALLVRNPKPAQIPVNAPVATPDSIERAEGSIADGTAYPA
ncbi:MAG TPA: DHA2 family efflux MFS transporter permease subunit [Thermomicrobiales bacterium]|nr:DHA2 family efflux MFS transporter permease subunit [Thermomicrobiales bacterium]